MYLIYEHAVGDCECERCHTIIKGDGDDSGGSLKPPYGNLYQELEENKIYCLNCGEKLLEEEATVHATKNYGNLD